MNGPTPLPPQGPLILEALRLVEAANLGEALLPALAGAEVKAVLAEIQAQGLLLLLSDGRKLTATGELPYPPGTTLTFRVQPQPDGTTQLQPLRADPPVPPPLLAPLLQGEAAALLQRLAAPEVVGPLVPLKDLLARLPGPPSPDPSLPPALAPLAEALGLPAAPEAAGAEGPGQTPPRASTSASAGGGMPPPSASLPGPPSGPPLPPAPAIQGRALVEALVDRGVPRTEAPRLAALLAGAPLEAADPAPAARGGPLGQPHPAEPELPVGVAPPLGLKGGPEGSAPLPLDPQATRTAPPALAPETLGRLLQAASRLPLPGAAAPTLDPALPPKVRETLERLPPALAQRVLLLLHLLPPAGQGTALPPRDPIAQLLKALLPDLTAALARAEATPSAPTSAALPPSALDPGQPATWERWLRATIETLAHPEASPQEAPFHRLQAREGTALFELPLPWQAERPQVELWAERDPGEGETSPTSRVLLAVNLGRTGELRVALQAGPAGTRGQVVAGAEVAAELGALLREELGDPPPFPVQVRPSEPLPPRPRALAGQGLRALG